MKAPMKQFNYAAQFITMNREQRSRYKNKRQRSRGRTMIAAHSMAVIDNKIT